MGVIIEVALNGSQSKEVVYSKGQSCMREESTEKLERGHLI